MGYDWIKLDRGLAKGDPDILELARRLRDADQSGHVPRNLRMYAVLALGAVSFLWITCADSTDDADVAAITREDIEELTGIEGLCNLLPAKWLEVLDSDHLKLPKFHAHNGTKALAAASNSDRQRRHRTKKRNGVP